MKKARRDKENGTTASSSLMYENAMNILVATQKSNDYFIKESDGKQTMLQTLSLPKVFNTCKLYELVFFFYHKTDN